MIIKNMIKPNIKKMPPSGIRKYFDLVNEMKDAISLGIGEPDFVTPRNIRQAGIDSLKNGNTHYCSNLGMPELRKEISKYLEEKYNIKYDYKTQIMVTVGASEAIDLALRTLVGPGDEVIIPEPNFVSYRGCATFSNATPITINLRAEDDFKLTPQLLENAITEKTKVLILTFPNNPTGATMNKDELEKIVQVLKDKDIIVISDEIYSELTYNQKHVSIASFPEMKERTIVINGFSKTFAMTGWRLGYACAHPEIISAMNKIHQYSIMSASTTSQYSAIEALRNCDNDVEKMFEEYDKRRKVIVNGFRKIGLKCFEPLGSFYVFPCIKSTGLTSKQFCEGLLKEEKVLVIPGNAFGDCGEGYVRACYASSMDNIIEALNRIKRFVDGL